MVIWFSSKRIPCCRFLPSSSLRLSPSIQQQSWLRDCSPILTLQLLALLHTCGHVFQVGVCKTVARIGCVFLTLFILTVTNHVFHPPLRTSNASLMSQLISLGVGISSLLQHTFLGVQVLFCLDLLLPLSFHPIQLMHGSV